MPSIYFKIMPREWLFDEKLNALGLEYKGAWANVLALVKLCNQNGKLQDEIEEPLTQDQIIKKSRIQALHFAKFIACEMIAKESKNGQILYSVKNWLKYQPEYDRTKVYRNSLKELNIKTKDKDNHETRLDYTSVLHPKETNPGVANLHPNESKYSKRVIKSTNTSKSSNNNDLDW